MHMHINAPLCTLHAHMCAHAHAHCMRTCVPMHMHMQDAMRTLVLGVCLAFRRLRLELTSCMCMGVCAWVHVHGYMCMGACAWVHAQGCMRMCAHTCACDMHVHRMYMCMHDTWLPMHVPARSCMHVYHLCMCTTWLPMRVHRLCMYHLATYARISPIHVPPGYLCTYQRGHVHVYHVHHILVCTMLTMQSTRHAQETSPCTRDIPMHTCTACSMAHVSMHMWGIAFGPLRMHSCIRAYVYIFLPLGLDGRLWPCWLLHVHTCTTPMHTCVRIHLPPPRPQWTPLAVLAARHTTAGKGLPNPSCGGGRSSRRA